MFDRDFYTEILHAIAKNKMRSTLTAFGVFWGIFMLIVLYGAGNGLQNGIEKELEGFATNAAFVWTEPTTVAYKGYKKGRAWNLDNGDMQAVLQNVTEVEYLVPRLQGWKQNTPNNTVYKDQYGTFSLNGDYPALAKVEPFEILKGRFLNDMDIRESRKVCVIGPRVEEILFKNGEDPLGSYIRVSGVYFQVVGVFDASNNMSFGYDKREAIHIPFTTMQRAFNYGDMVHFFSFTAHAEYAVSEVENQIIDILKKRNDISPEDTEAIGHVNIERQFKIVSNTFLGINILTFIVGIGTLLAGVIGISNIMLVIVKERTQEIGVKRAIGAKPANVVTQIIMESVFLTITAGYVGMILGILLNEGLGAAFGPENDGILLNPGINLSSGLMFLGILVLAGAFAGLLPASKAVKVKPIDAIRYE